MYLARATAPRSPTEEAERGEEGAERIQGGGGREGRVAVRTEGSGRRARAEGRGQGPNVG